MAASHNFSSRYRRLVDRLTARWIGLKSFPVTDLLEVEPRSIGSPELGRQILSGQFVLQGHLFEMNTACLARASTKSARRLESAPSSSITL